METTLSIGDFAARSGVSVSAVRFYEQNGLITSTRTSGNQRRYARTELRRLAVVRAARQLGIPLADIQTALATLPDGRAPTRRDWTRCRGGGARRSTSALPICSRSKTGWTGVSAAAVFSCAAARSTTPRT